MWHVFKWWPGRPHNALLLLLFCLFIFSFSFVFFSNRDYQDIQYNAWYSYDRQSYRYGKFSLKNRQKIHYNDRYLESVGGYLVYNEKCHMASMNPYDPSIRQFVRKEKIESCSSESPLSSISRKSDGNIYLVIDKNAANYYKDLSCCWAMITRPRLSINDTNKFDSKIR